MIQVNELRIGNYIHNEVQGINFKVCNVVISRLYFGDSKGYKPIELTEEVLLKCGSEYSKALCLYRLKESNVIYEYCEEEDECNYFIHFYHDGTNLNYRIK